MRVHVAIGVAAVLLATGTAFAQPAATEPGGLTRNALLVSGRIATGFNPFAGGMALSLNPTLEYMVSDIVAIGLYGSWSYSHFRTERFDSEDSIGFGELDFGARLATYFGSGRVRPFLALQVGYTHLFIEESADGNGIAVNPQLGVLFALTDRVTLDLATGYTFTFSRVSTGGHDTDLLSHILPLIMGVGVAL